MIPEYRLRKINNKYIIYILTKFLLYFYFINIKIEFKSLLLDLMKNLSKRLLIKLSSIN